MNHHNLLVPQYVENACNLALQCQLLVMSKGSPKGGHEPQCLSRLVILSGSVSKFHILALNVFPPFPSLFIVWICPCFSSSFSKGILSFMATSGELILLAQLLFEQYYHLFQPRYLQYCTMNSFPKCLSLDICNLGR